MFGYGRNFKFILIIRPALWPEGSPHVLLPHCTLHRPFPQKSFVFLLLSWSVLSGGPEKNLKSSKKTAQSKSNWTCRKKFNSNNRDWSKGECYSQSVERKRQNREFCILLNHHLRVRAKKMLFSLNSESVHHVHTLKERMRI